MFVEPGVQVKPVVNTAPTKTDFWHVQLCKKRDPDAEIHRCLLFGQTPNRGQRQAFFHDGDALKAFGGPAISFCALLDKALLEGLGQTWRIDRFVEFA